MTPEEHEQRRSYIGGSDAAAIVAGGDAWRKLWAVKTGRAEPEDDLYDLIVNDPATNRFMMRYLSRERLELASLMGRCTEPLNIFWFEKQTGRAVSRRGEVVRSFQMNYLGCTLDGVTTNRDGEPATFQAKHVGKAGDAVTLRYTAQCTHEALVLGYDFYVMSTLVGNSRWEMHEAEIDPFFAADYLSKCAEFWSYVESDKEPPEAAPLPVPAPRKLREVSLGEDADKWPNWGAEMAEQIDIWQRTKPAHDRCVLARESVKTLMPDDVGLILRDRVRISRDRSGAVRVSVVGEKDADRPPSVHKPAWRRGDPTVDPNHTDKEHYP